MARRSGQVIFDTISNLTFHYVGLDYFWGEGTGDVFFPSENKEHVPLCTANLTNNYASSIQNTAALSGSASCAMNPCPMSSLPDIYASRDSTCGNTWRIEHRVVARNVVKIHAHRAAGAAFKAGFRMQSAYLGQYFMPHIRIFIQSISARIKNQVGIDLYPFHAVGRYYQVHFDDQPAPGFNSTHSRSLAPILR